MSERATLQAFLTGKYIPTIIEKPLMRRPRARMGPLMHVCIKLFTEGAIIGRARREQLLTIATMLGDPERVTSITEWIQKLGNDIMADYKRSPRSVIDLFLDSVLEPPWQSGIASTARDTESLEKATMIAQHAVVMGIAFGVRHPELIPDMWRHDLDRTANREWWETLASLKVPVEPEPSSYEDKERMALRDLAIFVRSEYPKLLEPLSLADIYRDHLQAGLEKEQTTIREGQEFIAAYEQTRASPKEVYEEMMGEIVDLAAAAARERTLTQETLPVVEAIILGGCSAAARAVSTIGELERLWQKASDAERTALAEVCAQEVMVYLLSSEKGLPISVIEEYAQVVDAFFDNSFPNAVAFAASLFKQKEHDEQANARRKQTGEAGVSLWASSMALQGAVSALGETESPLEPVPDRFPVSDSGSLQEAGVGLTYWDGQITDTIAFFSILVDYVGIAMKYYSEKRKG